MTYNPFAELSATIPAAAMQAYVVLMFVLVVAGTLADIIHKKSAKYFFQNAKKAEAARTREVGGGEKTAILAKTVASDVLTSSEFCNPKRRLAHLLTMYGFIAYVATTAILVFGHAAPHAAAPVVVTALWHLGALSVCLGGYWFWFFIRVDVAAEGYPWYRIMRADLFVLSLLASTTFALLWSVFQANDAALLTSICFWLFVISSTVLFGGVMWSKFAHMFFKPAAAYQKHVAEADGSMDNLPPPADSPETFGLGIKRELPRHY
ncbi:MAG: adenylyl-sulfate reductase [Gammaproteobacteria bacterium]|nr:adenylyl-sulfate reductase [Gammaproteobacteria bacterium]